MDSRISAIDKIAILYRTGVKILRGAVQTFPKGSTWNASSWKRSTNFPW